MNEKSKVILKRSLVTILIILVLLVLLVLYILYGTQFGKNLQENFHSKTKDSSQENSIPDESIGSSDNILTPPPLPSD